MAKKTEVTKKETKVAVEPKKKTVAEKPPVAKPPVKEPVVIPRNEKPKSTPPLFIPTKQKEEPKEEGPVTQDELEKIMKYIGPRLKDPKTKAEAEKELADLHVRLRTSKHIPQW